MSHNVHRIPAKLRRAAAEEMGHIGHRTPEKAVAVAAAYTAKHRHKRRTRRYKRRPEKALQAKTARKHSGLRWLASHIWHAKRMHMRAAWGIKVAERRTDKGRRASLMAAEHLCTAHDASHEALFQVDGDRAAAAAMLARVASPETRPGIGAVVWTVLGRVGRTTLHRVGQFPRGAICPAEFLWRPTAGADAVDTATTSVWIWVHRGAADEVMEQLKIAAAEQMGKVGVRSRVGQLARIELTGPRSTPVLCTVLTPSGVPVEAQRAVAMELW
jgi:ribonuclease P/MRP protein subunit POP1